jgi:ribosome-binding protein aMBF1 (putative translation factor)
MHALTTRVRLTVQLSRMHRQVRTSELARMTNIPPGDLRSVEEGSRVPSSAMLKVLQETLGLDAGRMHDA